MRKPKETKATERVVIAKYIRVSTDKQREEGYSVDIQKERLDSYARSLFPESTYDVEYREYVDDGFSGGSLERPQMTQLIEDVKNGVITHVIVMKLDRLSRSQKDTLYLIEDIFLPNNVAFISMGESFNTDTPFGRAVVGILSVFAQLERENIFERTRSGMQKRVELGYWPGGGAIPFGYDYDANQGILIPNGNADTVRTVFELYTRGYSAQYIANLLGLKYDKLVNNILTRKTYTGAIVYNSIEYKGKHQPIISEELYEKVQAMIQDRSSKRFVSATTNLLTGMVYCGRCGAKMRYIKWGKHGRSRLMCYSQEKSKPYLVKDPDCENEKPWADDVEDTVIKLLFERAHVNECNNTNEEQADPVKMLQSQRVSLVNKLKRLYIIYAEGDDAITQVINETKEEVAKIEKRIEGEIAKRATTIIEQDIQEKLSSLEESWQYLDVSEKQNIVRSLINKVTITGHRIHIDFKI